MTRSEFFDVLIIGGGPAASAAAITLAHYGLNTAIIERSNYCNQRIGETLPSAIRNLLVTLGVWQHFLADDHLESSSIFSAWGSSNLVENNHIYNPYGSGWHIDRNKFDYMLAIAAEHAGSTLLTQTCINKLSQNKDAEWEIIIRQHNILRYLYAPLIIDATGQTTAIPTGLPRFFQVIDHLIGIIYFFTQIDKPYTLIESGSCGWWYSSPLPKDRLVVAYMTDADIIATSNYSLQEYWYAQLAKTSFTSARINPRSALINCKIVSAASLIRYPIFGLNWISVGDASMTFDPLSGQGVYKAIKNGIQVAEAINDRINGNIKSFSEYSKCLNIQFINYLQIRKVFYSKEQRWPKSPFWNRRRL
jgi:flavin-dependent dehydrogenase